MDAQGSTDIPCHNPDCPGGKLFRQLEWYPWSREEERDCLISRLGLFLFQKFLFQTPEAFFFCMGDLFWGRLITHVQDQMMMM